MNEADDILAARFALGIAHPREASLSEARIQNDPEFADAVSRYQIVFEQLHQGGQSSTARAANPQSASLKPELFDRIEAAIDDIELRAAPRTIRPQDLTWEVVDPLLERKILYTDDAGIAQIILYKAAPGAVVERHRNWTTEECLVLTGRIEVDGVAVNAGELHIVYPHSHHSQITSQTGALIYVRESLDVGP